ncbi:hypothetical protein CERSUDRAFT_112674 [Gelatoporia subvermispora B]|uniref:Uncharacterized protein n=1 Tax=Ceriporiopsis subvermispora (strain B) TaxID=914234 RepID=M2R364_CERS8|nr:hypothetical protein CERSUDRAFT_112674 [Gelatoporia subvermispora B]
MPEYGHVRTSTAGSLRSRPPLPNGPRSPSKQSTKTVIPLDLNSRIEEASPAYSSGPPSSLSRTSSPFASSFSFSSDRPNSSEVCVEKIGTSEKGVQASAGDDPPVAESARVSTPAVKLIPKTPSLSPPPALSFDPPQVQWKGMTLEAAKWTFTSEELQEIVSGAIRKSASESFIRLVPLKTLDEELIAELDRLDSLKGTTQSQYRFNMHKRTMLLQSLNALSFSAGTDGDAEALANLTKQLADLTVSCDRLMETLVSVADQRAQIQRIQDVHIASALAMGLRKLNDSFRRRTTELQEAKTRIQELKAELDEAWEVAQDMAQEMDDLDNFHSGFSDDEDDDDALDYTTHSVHSAQIIEITGKAVASKATLVSSPKQDFPLRGDRISRVLSAKKRSSRASKASLRIPRSSSGAADKADRASIMSRRSRSKSLRRRSTAAEEIPDVPAIQVNAAPPKDSFLEMSETRPVSPMTASATSPEVPPLPTPSAFENRPMRQFLGPGDESPTLATAARAPLPPSPGFDHAAIPRDYTEPTEHLDRRRSLTARRVQSVPPLSRKPRIADSLVDVSLRPSTSDGPGRPTLDAPIWRRFTVPVMAAAAAGLPCSKSLRSESASSLEANGSHQSISGD